MKKILVGANDMLVEKMICWLEEMLYQLREKKSNNC